MMALSCNQGGLLAWLLLLLSLTQVQTQCPTPVLPPHSSLRGGGDLEDTYPAGTNLPLRCISGYEYISGSVPRITCLATGKWTDLPTLCQGQRCPVPNIDNGNIVSTNDLRLGEQVTLGCEYGFRIIGGDTRLCVLKGGKVDWDREFPICQRIPCFRPPVIANGRYDPNPSDVYEAGSVIMYRCDPDYSLIGHSTITCVVAKNGVDGEWNRPSPECKTQCPTPVLPPHSSLRGGGDLVDTYPVGTNLQLQCISGYEYISGRVPRLTCLATGKWSDLPTLCQGQRCPVPNIDNGNIVSSNDLRLGEKVTLGCDYGFRIIGSDTRLCVWKGAKVDWDRELPICQRIPCVPPPVIANGRYDPTASGVYNVGSVVIYRCDADYSLIGKSAIICGVAKNGVDGEWNRPSPECKKVKCHRPHIPNGRVDSVFQATYTYQNKLLIGCNPGYSFIESSVIECDADNQWKPPGPWCDKLTDPTSTPPPNPSEEEKSIEDRLDIIEKKLDLILHILQLTRHRKTIR